MKISLLAGASCLALIACGGAMSDQAAGVSTGGSSGALVSSGGQTLGGSGGVQATGSGGSSASSGGAPRCNGSTLTPLNLYPNCDGKTETTCVEVPFNVCFCDGTTGFGFGNPVPIRHLGPCTDAERADAAAGSGGAPSDASPSDAGSYCIYEAPGAGGSPSTYCVPFPNGCSSCSCITLPYSFCTCGIDTNGVLVRCLGA